MSPESTQWTEWMQPIRTMRIKYRMLPGEPLKDVWVYVFAMRTSPIGAEYLSLEGTIILASSRLVLYAQTLIGENWESVG